MASSHRKALALSILTIGYNILEGIVSVVAATLAGSTAFLEFGLDSPSPARSCFGNSGSMARNGRRWVPHDTRDQVVDYVNHWRDRSELAAKQLLAWLGPGKSKFNDWKGCYGKANEHNGKVPRDWWLVDWKNHASTAAWSDSPDASRLPDDASCATTPNGLGEGKGSAEEHPGASHPGCPPSPSDWHQAKNPRGTMPRSSRQDAPPRSANADRHEVQFKVNQDSDLSWVNLLYGRH